MYITSMGIRDKFGSINTRAADDQNRYFGLGEQQRYTCILELNISNNAFQPGS